MKRRHISLGRATDLEVCFKRLVEGKLGSSLLRIKRDTSVRIRWAKQTDEARSTKEILNLCTGSARI